MPALNWDVASQTIYGLHCTCVDARGPGLSWKEAEEESQLRHARLQWWEVGLRTEHTRSSIGFLVRNSTVIRAGYIEA